MEETSLGAKENNGQAYIHSFIHLLNNVLFYQLEIYLSEINGKCKIG